MSGPATTRPSVGAGEGPAPARRTSRRALIWSGAALVAVALVVWIVAFSPVLGVSTVRVRGLRTLSAAQVIAASGVHHGEPLVRVDTGVVARHIESLPAVASATVHTSYPNTVTIDVIERVAIGYLVDGSQYVLVDHEGKLFRTVAERPVRIPVFEVPAGPQQADADSAVAQVAAALPTAVLGQIASIQAFDANAITLLLVDHRVVAWGSADRTADKAAILPALLTRPGTSIDVSNPDQVVVR